MKLNELSAVSTTKQAAKVLESYFGNRVSFDTMSTAQARGMLKRVCALIAEHRKTPGFYNSQQNPAYLKLVMMEQALAAVATQPGMSPQQQAGMQAAQVQQKKRQIQDAIRAKQAEIAELQKQMNNPTMAMSETRQRRLSESEVQQAQVVLASQDMVDQVQKMSEQVSAMQFKDLPALCDQIKNEVGVDQAMQFNTDATGALAGLLQNLQGAKQQLESALGVVTGQAPTVPGEDMNATPELPAPDDEEIPEPELDLDADADIEEPAAGTFGRGRR
jgi:DNA anti-recombination protein RmuC